jgi:hydroxyacylglutathione hydrolase
MIEIRAVHTPGHTPEHLSFLVYDHGGGADDPIGIATGDFVFVGDVGRPDLLETAAGLQGSAGPAAHELHESLRWFDRLDPWLQVWPGHGAGSACGKALGAIPTTTVGYEQRYNPALRMSREGADPFVEDILSGQTEPPLYFARMKRENRDGPAILGELPSPSHTQVEQIDRAVESGAALLDTREWSEFRVAHLKGSYYVPWENSFPTIAGSYVDPDQQIYLILETTENLDEIIRSLVRVGLDRVTGYATAEELKAFLQGNNTRAAEIRTTTAEGLAAAMLQKDVTVLDVRGASEYEVGHVKGALQLAHTRLPTGLPNLPEGLIYIHCKSGARSAIASAWLQANGRNVTYVGGAFSDFKEAGLPVESGRTEAVAE